MENPFGFHVEHSVKRVLTGTKKRSPVEIAEEPLRNHTAMMISRNQFGEREQFKDVQYSTSNMLENRWSKPVPVQSYIHDHVILCYSLLFQ